MRKGSIAAALAAGACLLLTGACAAQGEKPATPPAAPAPAAPPPADPAAAFMKSPADVARGKALFVGTCGAYCHRMNASQSDAPYLFDCDWLHGGSNAEVFHTITHGVTGTRMVAFGGAIPDEDIWRIIAYLKSASECKK
jgi:mono/diheme cytochrome c family protein